MAPPAAEQFPYVATQFCLGRGVATPGSAGLWRQMEGSQSDEGGTMLQSKSLKVPTSATRDVWTALKPQGVAESKAVARPGLALTASTIGIATLVDEGVSGLWYSCNW